jgi:hypothetical protein
MAMMDIWYVEVMPSSIGFLNVLFYFIHFLWGGVGGRGCGNLVQNT